MNFLLTSNCLVFKVGVLGYICFHDVGVKGDVLTNYGNGFVVEIIKCGKCRTKLKSSKNNNVSFLESYQ